MTPKVSRLLPKSAGANSIVQGLEGLRMAEREGQPFGVAWTCWGLANVYLVRGELGEAVRLLDRALALAREWQLGAFFPFVPWSLGRAYTLSARVAEGLSLLQESLRTHAARKLGNWESLIITHLAEAWLLSGRPDEALASGQRAVALARERSERGFEAYALHILGEIAAHGDPPDVQIAEGQYHSAMTLAEQLGMRPLVARCHLGLGTLCRRAGRPEQAKDHLTTAAAMLRDMEMHLWLAQAEATLQQVS